MQQEVRTYKTSIIFLVEYRIGKTSTNMIALYKCNGIILTQKWQLFWHFDNFFVSSFRCPDYTNLPLGCSMVKVTGQCCPVVNCTAGSTGTFVGSGTIPTIGGYPIPSIKPTAAPNPLNPGGPTVAPQLVPKQIGGWTEIENSNYAVLRNWIIWLFLKVGWDTLQS